MTRFAHFPKSYLPTFFSAFLFVSSCLAQPNAEKVTPKVAKNPIVSAIDSSAIINLNCAVVTLSKDVADSPNADTTINYVLFNEAGTPSKEEADQLSPPSKIEEKPKKKKGLFDKIEDALKPKLGEQDKKSVKIGGVRCLESEAKTFGGSSLYLLIRKGSQFINAKYEKDINKGTISEPAGAGAFFGKASKINFEIDSEGRTLSNILVSMGEFLYQIKLPAFTYNGVKYYNGCLFNVQTKAMPIYLEDKFSKNYAKDGKSIFAKGQFIPDAIDADGIQGKGRRAGKFAIFAEGFGGEVTTPGEDEFVIKLNRTKATDEADQMKIYAN